MCYALDSLASNSMKSSNPNSGFHETEIAKTLDTSTPEPSKNQGGIAIVQTVAIEGNGSRPSHKGDGYAETDTMYTLNATEVHGVAYAVDCRNCEISEVNGAMQAKPQGGFSYNCNQVCMQPVSYGFYPQMKAECVTFTEEKANCIVNGTNPGFQNGVVQSVSYGLDRASFNQGQNAKYDFSVTEESMPTLVAKGPNAVAQYAEPQYIVRRLTPTECARLQGFHDTWGSPVHKDALTDEEYQFWLTVRNTHAAIMGKAVKDYTKKQMLKWYNKLHSDSNEYKMWGNGIALPCALYVMQGIKEVLDARHQSND